jgi:hypothetical protein
MEYKHVRCGIPKGARVASHCNAGKKLWILRTWPTSARTILGYSGSCYNSTLPVNYKWRETTVSLGLAISKADKLFTSGDKVDYRFKNHIWNSPKPNHNFIEIYVHIIFVFMDHTSNLKILFPLTFSFIYVNELTNETVMDWINLGQDRDQWRALVNTVMNLWIP